jgi:type I restriction enzyme M protein
MGAVFEELIRKFAELSNETAGEHFTPREVIRLMVNLLFIEDEADLTKPGVVRSLYDPTAGTGGMLSVAGEHLAALNPDARLVMYGQELNAESYAICKADMLIKGQDIGNIIFGLAAIPQRGGKLTPAKRPSSPKWISTRTTSFSKLASHWSPPCGSTA